MATSVPEWLPTKGDFEERLQWKIDELKRQHGYFIKLKKAVKSGTISKDPEFWKYMINGLDQFDDD